jgi:SAM-dependent methyltransferase
MPDWNKLILEERFRPRYPQTEVYRFVITLEKIFTERPLRIWDLCCGGGRHTVLMSSLGHRVYASDLAPNALELTRAWLADAKLSAELDQVDMTICPWSDISFHGVVSWNALYHNTFSNIQRSISMVYDCLLPNGLFMGTFKSTKADTYGLGPEIEPNTFICPDGPEQGQLHYFFDEITIRRLFEGWEFISLVEQRMKYLERGQNFLEYNPFPNTTWCVLVRKKV